MDTVVSFPRIWPSGLSAIICLPWADEPFWMVLRVSNNQRGTRVLWCLESYYSSDILYSAQNEIIKSIIRESYMIETFLRF